MILKNESHNIRNASLARLKNCLPTKLGWKKLVRDQLTVHFGLKTQNEQGCILLASGLHFLHIVAPNKQPITLKFVVQKL
jgi:hypothetical protein